MNTPRVLISRPALHYTLKNVKSYFNASIRRIYSFALNSKVLLNI